MAQEVHHIKIFPEEQLQVIGMANVTDATAPMFGVARVGDKTPTEFRSNITPANKIPNRIPRIPCQFVVIGFDSGGNKIQGGDVKNGFLYNGTILPNGNTVELTWSVSIKNEKYLAPFGDNRSPQQGFEESAQAGAAATAWFRFAIDETGLLIPGNDGMLQIPPNTPIGDTAVQFTQSFVTDRTGDGVVKAAYAEETSSGTKTNQLPTATAKAVITQPDWAVAGMDTPNGWTLP